MERNPSMFNSMTDWYPKNVSILYKDELSITWILERNIKTNKQILGCEFENQIDEISKSENKLSYCTCENDSKLQLAGNVLLRAGPNTSKTHV